MLRPAYDESDGRDGFVSFECTPDLADETQATIEQAIELSGRIDRPNVMIKVPATEAGIPAIQELTARGVNVNITLLFSLTRYEQVIDAYIAGLERRLAAGERVDAISSVASFFVSRVDAKADPLLPAGSALRGRVAIANAHRAYARYRERFADERWLALREAGARPQRPLWASTRPPRRRSSGPTAKASTSMPSRPTSNARECTRFAPRTTTCCTASRQRRHGSPRRAGVVGDRVFAQSGGHFVSRHPVLGRYVADTARDNRDRHVRLAEDGRGETALALRLSVGGRPNYQERSRAMGRYVHPGSGTHSSAWKRRSVSAPVRMGGRGCAIGH